MVSQPITFIFGAVIAMYFYRPIVYFMARFSGWMYLRKLGETNFGLLKSVLTDKKGYMYFRARCFVKPRNHAAYIRFANGINYYDLMDYTDKDIQYHVKRSIFILLISTTLPLLLLNDTWYFVGGYVLVIVLEYAYVRYYFKRKPYYEAYEYAQTYMLYKWLVTRQKRVFKLTSVDAESAEAPQSPPTDISAILKESRLTQRMVKVLRITVIVATVILFVTTVVYVLSCALNPTILSNERYYGAVLVLAGVYISVVFLSGVTYFGMIAAMYLRRYRPY